MRYEEFTWHTGDGLRLFARAWKPDDEPRAVVSLAHGIGEHGARFAAMADALTAAGFAVLVCDLRGHGRSDGVRGHAPGYERMMDDIALLLEQAARMFPARPRFLYGHSLGGNLALNYALRRRPALAGVTATGPMLRMAAPPPAWKMLAARLLSRGWPTFLFDNGVSPDDCTQNAELAREHRDDPLRHSRVSARLGLDLLEAGAWALAHAADFPLPLLLMQGGDDRVTSLAATREFAARARGKCTLKIWDGLFHELHGEPGREAVFAYLIEWLTAHLPSARLEDY
jgi:alpha-beta hydrolase superfamily lysophospholipase